MPSQFFGHSKGAFTGASQEKKGFFEMANGGTIFLDEIGEAPPELQVKLLRVIQESEIMPVGYHQPKKVDVRIIASTNRDLKAEVMANRFRQDLFFRINVFSVTIPPLRERKGDILPLADFFLEQLSQKLNRRTARACSARKPAICWWPTPGRGMCGSCRTRLNAWCFYPKRKKRSDRSFSRITSGNAIDLLPAPTEI